MKTTLYILDNPFKDPAVSPEDFFCQSCVLMEGLLATFPDGLKELVVRRVPFPRPRDEIIELVGSNNQSLPVLILGDDVLPGRETGTYGSTRYIKGNVAMLNALTDIYGIARNHP